MPTPTDPPEGIDAAAELAAHGNEPTPPSPDDDEAAIDKLLFGDAGDERRDDVDFTLRLMAGPDRTRLATSRTPEPVTPVAQAGDRQPLRWPLVLVAFLALAALGLAVFNLVRAAGAS